MLRWVFVRAGVAGITLALALCGSAFAARACPELNLAVWTADSSRDAQQCMSELKTRLGITTCALEQCKVVADWSNKPAPELVAGASAVVAKIRDDLSAQVGEGFIEARPVLQQVDAFLLRLRFLKPEELAAASPGPLAGGPVSFWAYDEASHTVLAGKEGEVQLIPLFDTECAASKERCERALRGAARTVADVWLLEVTSNVFLRDKRLAFSEHLALLDKRWSSFFDGARFQYPWELAVNSRFFNPGAGARGLVGPPTDQLIFLHPSVGLRYRRGADTEYSQAVVLEVLGYARWRWNDADIAGLLGGSLVATWTDDTKRNRPAVGLMLHLPSNYSLGITVDATGSARKTSILLSADLGKLFQDPAALKQKLLSVMP